MKFCAFCGAYNASLVSMLRMSAVHCPDCGAQGPSFPTTDPDHATKAVAAWEHRHGKQVESLASTDFSDILEEISNRFICYTLSIVFYAEGSKFPQTRHSFGSKSQSLHEAHGLASQLVLAIEDQVRRESVLLPRGNHPLDLPPPKKPT